MPRELNVFANCWVDVRGGVAGVAHVTDSGGEWSATLDVSGTFNKINLAHAVAAVAAVAEHPDGDLRVVSPSFEARRWLSGDYFRWESVPKELYLALASALAGSARTRAVSGPAPRWEDRPGVEKARRLAARAASVGRPVPLREYVIGRWGWRPDAAIPVGKYGLARVATDGSVFSGREVGAAYVSADGYAWADRYRGPARISRDAAVLLAETLAVRAALIDHPDGPLEITMDRWDLINWVNGRDFATHRRFQQAVADMGEFWFDTADSASELLADREVRAVMRDPIDRFHDLAHAAARAAARGDDRSPYWVPPWRTDVSRRPCMSPVAALSP